MHDGTSRHRHASATGPAAWVVSMTPSTGITIQWQKLSVAGTSHLTWNAADRDGGLLVPKLAKERGSKAVGDEGSPKASATAALWSTLDFTIQNA